MKKIKCFMKQYPHGFNDGFEYHDGKAPPLTISSWQANNFVIFYEENPNSETRRGRKMADKSNGFMAQNDTNFMNYEGPRIITLNGRKVRVLGIRRLTPTECARLQTIPEWYKWDGMSDSQRYRVLGNGWTVEVIKHFFSFLPFAKEIK